MMQTEAVSRRTSSSHQSSIYTKGLDWKLILVGIVLIAWGQLQLVQDDSHEGDGFFGSGRLFLILGFGAIAVAAYFFKARLGSASWRVSPPRMLRFDLGGLRKTSFGIGVAALAFLVLRLLGGSTSGGDIWIWLVALVGFSIPFAPSITRALVGLRKARRSVRWADVVIVSVLAAIFIGYTSSDLTDWYYSAIGDEFGFYELATDFVENGISAPFSQRGVDDYHPRLGMLMKSVVMDVVGADNFGWKFSSVVMFALTIPAVYLIGTLIGGRVAGAVAAATLAISHYLIGFTHIGYDHIDSLLPATWAFALFFLAMRTKSPFLFFVAGVVAGLCMYTNVAARIVYPVIIAFFIWRAFIGDRKDFRNWAIPMLVGVAVTALPIFVVDGSGLVDQMLGRVIGGQGEATELGTIERLIRNLELNLYAFNYNEHITHYVSGSLLDPVSAVIAVAAVAFALGRIGDPASDFLVIWLALGFAATGGLSPYDWHVATTRLFPLMIPLSLAMGLFIAKFVWPVDINFYAAGESPVLSPKLITIVALMLAGGLVWILNYQRSEVDTPSVYHNSPIAVTIGAIKSEHCAQLPGERVAIVSRGEHVVRRILDSYDPGSIQTDPHAPPLPDSPVFLNHEQALDGGLGDANRFGCVIFSHPWEPEPTRILNELQASIPNGVVIRFSDLSRKTTISIFKPL